MQIKVMNLETKKTWVEKFTSYYYMQERIRKLKWSKRLRVIGTENQGGNIMNKGGIMNV